VAADGQKHAGEILELFHGEECGYPDNRDAAGKAFCWPPMGRNMRVKSSNSSTRGAVARTM
jgi:hypothetical protein